jgi:nicotinate phosphoribosyltransferase
MIINSLLDTDLYKLTMMQAVRHQFTEARVAYTFQCRTPGIDLTPLADEIERQVAHLGSLRFAPEELDYLDTLRFIKPGFVDYLRGFRLDPGQVRLLTGNDGLELHIEGPWSDTILFEVPVLAIISELYGRGRMKGSLKEGRRRLDAKIAAVQADADAWGTLRFCDFGTRRRYSAAWQREVVAELARRLPESFIGTSNVRLAMDFGITPIGTMAHEWLMAAQALGPDLAGSQVLALDAWAQEYRGDLGIALSDVVGFDAFLKDFDMYFAKLFDGCRHDSGDPLAWGETLIAHYRHMGIDAICKTAVFSDGLTIPRAVELANHFKGRIRTSFGIGTHLTNDLGEKAIQIVIKMVRCQGKPVAKISDSPGKQMCRDEAYLARLKRVFADKRSSWL